MTPDKTPDVLRITLIRWRDATYASGWHFKSEIPTGPALVESVGWLIAETDEAVTLALSVSTDAIGHISVIPKSGIVDRFQLNED